MLHHERFIYNTTIEQWKYKTQKDMKAWIKANQPYIYLYIKLWKNQNKKKIRDIRSCFHINKTKILPRKKKKDQEKETEAQ
eukprot:10577894-Ditylum_brightwellii.AAC.1